MLQETKFAVTDTKIYVLVVTLLTQDNPKVLQQLKSVLKRTINSNKYQSKVSIQASKPYLNYLVDQATKLSRSK